MYAPSVVQNSLVAGGNALLGYEPRYDVAATAFGLALCTLYREILWPTTERSVNFGRRFQATQHLEVYSMLSQAVIGSGYHFVSEFALDILHAFGLKKDSQLPKNGAAFPAKELLTRYVKNRVSVFWVLF